MIAWIPALVLGGPGPVEIVRDGRPVAAIHAERDGEEAAVEIARYVEKMSGARLEVRRGRPGPAQPAIVVGALALEMGLPPPPKTVSGDGYRLRAGGGRVLLAGETAESTYFAACHFLELLGCRWFFDNPLGEVVPEARTLAVEPVDVEEQPDFISRQVWGPNWNSKTWQRRNRLGGLAMPTGHDWHHVPAARFGKDHPEYYAMRGGERKPGAWLCTSNPEVRRLFAEAVAGQVRGRGVTAISISPPDGTGYCECPACAAEDVPGYLEPSSGRVAVSDRYQRFYNAVGREVLKTNPEAILNFYAYADYSLPPREVRDAPPNLCAWVAPIRFCRLHSLLNPACGSRRRCREVVEGWAAAVPRIGWREYNYVLAELCLPFSKVSVWKDDLPWLKKKGGLGLNIESLALWHLYGLNTYLVARLAWKADAEADAILEDFYAKFCGKAAPHVRAYWERIDRASRETGAHAGSFYYAPAVWKPALVEACEADLAAAARAAENDLVRRRVEMFRRGLENVKYYLALRGAVNRCDFREAKEVFDRWMAHMDAIHAEGIHPVGEYKRGYAPRFLGPAVEAGFERVTGGRRRVLQLPDEWLFRYDPKGEGEAAGWHRPEASPEGWRRVRTHSATLNEQGVPEELTWMWYRTSFTAPADLPDGPLHLWFAEIDGKDVKVFLDGEFVGGFPGARRPGEVEVTGRLRAGQEHHVAVRIDHRRITELMLGGILQPVMVYAGPRPEPPPGAKQK